MHEAKGMADHLQNCQPGAGFTAVKALCASLVAMNGFCQGATLSALLCAGAGTRSAMESALYLAF